MIKEEELLATCAQELAVVTDIAGLYNVKSKFLGKTSVVQSKNQSLNTLQDPAERKQLGMRLNQLKNALETLFSQKKSEIEEQRLAKELAAEKINITFPGRLRNIGSIHPVSKTIIEMQKIFQTFGFKAITGPEIEDEQHNFDYLNIDALHPARQTHDTFYLLGTQLLRTHTSTVQIREMSKHTPPFQFIAHGKVYRKDYDATHTPMFHQMEGMMVGPEVNMANLKFIVYEFLKLFFAEQVLVRFRPSYFPFTEPSLEVDIRLPQKDRWIEIMGAGMIHPKVLANVGIDAEQYKGFAFGIGIERCAMLKYHIEDLRPFFQHDISWLQANNFSPFQL